MKKKFAKHDLEIIAQINQLDDVIYIHFNIKTNHDCHYF